MPKIIMTKPVKIIIFFLIFSFAAFTRFYGNNWDQGQHLNPDERFLTMVATNISWPKNFAEYLDTSSSPLNPHNKGFDFYVYGTWPVILVKFIAEKLNLGDYGNLTLVGRAMSGVVDLLTLVFVFLIGKKLSILTNSKPTTHNSQLKTHHYLAGLFAMFLYSAMALPIQLSHFFTTDPYLNLFLTITIFIFLFPPTIITGVLLGLSTGLALSAKISGVVILPIIGLYGILYILPELRKNEWVKLKIKCIHLVVFYTLFTVFFYLSFRLLMPYLFNSISPISLELNPLIINNWKTLKGFEDSKAWFPPGVQWINQPKIIYPLLDIVLIGLGIPMAIISFAGIIRTIKLSHKCKSLILLLTSFIVLFGYQSIQYGMNMRYFLPIYPLFAIFGSFLLINIWHRKNLIIKNSFYNFFIFLVILLVILVWPLAFLQIYTTTHSRVLASEWIFKNIPVGSKISFEHWDDPLPLNLADNKISSSDYIGVELSMFNEDTTGKWEEIQKKLNSIDYLIISSNRVYGSIGSAPERYPKSVDFYTDLFSEKLNFTKIAEFKSRPNLPFFINMCIYIPFFNYGIADTKSPYKSSCKGLEFIDDYTDESWTVYDHPKVTIFKKK